MNSWCDNYLPKMKKKKKNSFKTFGIYNKTVPYSMHRIWTIQNDSFFFFRIQIHIFWQLISIIYIRARNDYSFWLPYIVDGWKSFSLFSFDYCFCSNVDVEKRYHELKLLRYVHVLNGSLSEKCHAIWIPESCFGDLLVFIK